MRSIFKEIAIKRVPYFFIRKGWRCFQEFKIDLDQIEDSKTIYETDLELPLMNKNDKFYIEDQDKFVIILDVVRSDSAYVYIVDRNVAYDDEALRQYNKDKEAFLELKEIELENRKLKREIENFERSKYYRKYLLSNANKSNLV